MKTEGMHDVVSVEADHYEGTTWLRIKVRNGSTTVLFMPLEQAEAMAAAFNAHQPVAVE